MSGKGGESASPASQEHAHRARIDAVPAGVSRPTWSVMIPTYNCAAYLRETLHRVLEQALPPDEMQIEVVDDHSTQDDPEAVVREVGRGRVGFHRQPANVGHVANFNTALSRARGQLVHLLHGDDYVLHGFYTRLQRAFDSEPHIGAAFCRHVFMDGDGNWQGVGRLLRSSSGVLDDWLPRIAAGQLVQTPSVVVRREVYERLGGFDDRLRWVEDWEMWVRIAAHYPVWYEAEPLAVYRLHGQSSTSRMVRSGETLQDVERAIEINRGVLPPAIADSISAEASRNNARGALRRGQRALEEGELRAALVQLRGALWISRAPRLWIEAAGVLPRVALSVGRRLLRHKAAR